MRAPARAVIGGAERQIVAETLSIGVFRRHGQRVEGVGDPVGGVGVHGELGALLDHGAGERLGEAAGGQRHLDRRAAAFLVGLVAGDQRHLHLGAGPRVGGEVADGLADARRGSRSCGSDSGTTGASNSGRASVLAAAGSTGAISAWASTTP